MTEANIDPGSRTVFVTVGTTRFDSLVRAVDTDEVKEELYRRRYTNLLIQMGRGSYIPTKKLTREREASSLSAFSVTGKDYTTMESAGETGSLDVDYFTFSPSIADYLKAASLVISHAGSGSIFETLNLGKPLIVVVNEELMDNHQIELAEELAKRKHLFFARPQTLYQTIVDMDLESLIPYQPGDATPVVKLINRFLGFPEE